MDAPLQLTIETPEQWTTIAGDSAHKDMLYVVEVYASWCGPSQAATSTYRKIKDANEAKKFKLCKVCADLDCPRPKADAEGEMEPFFPLEKYKINAKPTFLLFKDGDQVAAVDGVSMPMLEKCAPHPHWSTRAGCACRQTTPPATPHACSRPCAALSSPLPVKLIQVFACLAPSVLPALQAHRRAHARGYP